jgi:polysaccharide biosynthesis protein PslH
MHVLSIGPMPTHAPTQGNRQRALDLNRAFRGAGYKTTYLYWAAEGTNPAAHQDMQLMWDDVIVLDPNGFSEMRSFEHCYGIDDWFDPRISAIIASIVRERSIDVCVVNYVWMSKALESLPATCVKIIDTHDLFGGRAQHFYNMGQKPEWFYTTVPEETKGLDRADIVIAIQDQEAGQLSARTQSEVTTIGFLNAPAIRSRPARVLGRPVKVGYIASDNPMNVASMLAFCSELENIASLNIELIAAGPVCNILRNIAGQPFKLLGLVPHLADFYEQVDLVINPMIGGTGLKIKTIEALAHRVGVIGTRDAFVGISSDFPAHNCNNPREVVAQLAKATGDEILIEVLQEASIEVFNNYLATQRLSFSMLLQRVAALRLKRLQLMVA